jgi:hypothetical protein
MIGDGGVCCYHFVGAICCIDGLVEEDMKTNEAGHCLRPVMPLPSRTGPFLWHLFVALKAVIISLESVCHVSSFANQSLSAER